MTPESPTTGAQGLQVCRNCGGGAPPDAHFCPQCSKILPIGRQGDYFAFLGIPRKLTLEPAVLEERFRALSRQFHPDYFHNATSHERRASLERSSFLNDAYRTLRNPVSRIEYLLQVEGLPAGGNGQGGKQVPASLLEDVFELNEELDAVRELRAERAPAEEWTGRLERARRPIEARRAAHEAELKALAERWDRLIEGEGARDERQAVLLALRERMLERNYISNLLAGIERELSGPSL